MYSLKCSIQQPLIDATGMLQPCLQSVWPSRQGSYDHYFIGGRHQQETDARYILSYFAMHFPPRNHLV